MIKRHYVFACYVAHNDGSGDREYWNTVITTKSWRKFSAEQILQESRCMAVEKISERVERPISEQDVQVVMLNTI